MTDWINSSKEAALQEAIQEWSTVHKPVLYDLDTSRERMSPALSKTRAYHLRVPDVPKGFIQKTTSAKDVLECRDTTLFDLFPKMRAFISSFVETLPLKTLGRVFVTRLQYHASIGRHVDEGIYFDTLHRHHIVLSSHGSKFCWDGYSYELKQGGLYTVNNSIPHWVENDSGWARTHLIFDAA